VTKRPGSFLGCWKCGSINLSVAGQRELIDRQELARHHRARESLAQVNAQFIAEVVARLAGRHNVCDEFGTVPVPTHHNKGVPHRRVTFHCGRYLSWLNPEAAKLDLVIGSPNEF
jgi:hypothetical protein